MNEDNWANVQVSGMTLEVPAAKDVLEGWLSRFWKGCAVDSDISNTITMTERTGIR